MSASAAAATAELQRLQKQASEAAQAATEPASGSGALSLGRCCVQHLTPPPADPAQAAGSAEAAGPAQEALPLRVLIPRGAAADPALVAVAGAALHTLTLSMRPPTAAERVSQAAASARTEGRSVESLLQDLSTEGRAYVNNGLAVLDAARAHALSAFDYAVPPPAPGYTISQAQVSAIRRLRGPEALVKYKLVPDGGTTGPPPPAPL